MFWGISPIFFKNGGGEGFLNFECDVRFQGTHYILILEELKVDQSQSEQKNVVFDNFSNFLQSLIYYFGHQTLFNQAYLMGFGRNLRPRTQFSHDHLP